MVVCKFGGSSVADANQIKKVKAILERDPNRSAVVVSAPGKRCKEDEKITDMLYQCNKDVNKGLSCRETFKKVAKRYLEIADELKVNKKELSAKLDEVRRFIDAGRGADYAASRGEYLSAYLISLYLGWEFIDSEDCIVINSDNTVNPITYDKLSSLLRAGGKYVIPGFYGRNEYGDVKTFSRGGSDITGSIIARALDAELYENWTDVAGVYSANPMLIPDAKPIERLSYKEVRELSEVGASVFHEEAIAPIVEKGIPINIKNTNDPDAKGTMIYPESVGCGIVGVSSKSGLSKLHVEKLMLFKKSGMRHALLTMIQIFGIRPRYSLFGIDSITWYFDSSMASDSVCQSMCERLKKEFALDSISVDRGLAVLGLIGPNIDKSTDYVEALVALRDANIPVSSVSYGASDTSCLIGIPEEQKDAAVKAVYDGLFR